MWQEKAIWPLHDHTSLLSPKRASEPAIGGGERSLSLVGEGHSGIESKKKKKKEAEKMQDWAPVFISFVLFILLSPGLIFQMPAKSRFFALGNFQTSVASILVHTLLFFALDAILLIAIGVQIQLGN